MNHKARIPGWIIAAVLPLIIPAVSFGQRQPRIRVLSFVTEPLIVSVVSGGPDGTGAIVGRQVGGMVTSQFPQAVVRLKLPNVSHFNKDDIPAAIKRNFKFQCGSELSQELPADWFGGDVFSFQDGTFSKQAGNRLLAPRFETDLTFISQRDAAMIVQIRCALPAAEGAASGEPPASVLEDVVGLHPDEPVLIGFPYNDKKRGRFIFWIALLLEYGTGS